MLLPVLVAAALAARAPIPPPPLTACTVAPLPTSVDPPALIAALSAPDPEHVSPYRAQVRTDVPVYLSPDTRAYAGDAIAGWHGAVVLADGPVLTLLTREGPVNLLIGVDRSALAPVQIGRAHV